MLDKIIGSVLSNVLGGSGNGGAQSGSVITDVLGSLLKNQGGMEGIFNQLQKGGLDDLLNSWIGTGQNKPMNAEQVNEVFGDETLSDVAQQAGVEKAQAQDILSQALPQIIDMLTPNGREGGVQPEVITQRAEQAQQEGFGLDDLLGGLLGGQQTQSQIQQGGLGDILGQILNQQPTRTSRTSAPSSNDELAQDIGSVLNNFFK
ncbi:YidB family protein [Bisgaard Taxon 10/6]|uniref:YidB family protein n=1 Tax=Exercitatus varius TaxID=67857 RepID=A0AAW6QAJ7_9PAST|nr:YidB family protein [Exercitatus varius]MDG2914752.1 YidB family protein [Exercitatus varius]MDG2917814.1 YidB family protein [Exercitatus varius]MDG2947588.1 YidB family protein [Exercitatus varius]MDG2950605.1 YidB family protein [Exercitatus varius]MDG2952626.1 YidB family protein [Exercitatus varius]